MRARATGNGVLMAENSDGLKRETKLALAKGVRELRQRITAVEYDGRMKGYREVHQQLIWLEIDARKIRDELFALENQETLPFDNTPNQNKDRMRP